MSSIEKDNETAVLKSVDGWNKGDLDGFLQIYDPNVVFHDIPGVQPGLENVKEFYRGFWLAFRGVHLTIQDMFSKEDKVCCRLEVSGEHIGEIAGIPATGKYASFTAITILKFKDGKCIERWSQADYMGRLV